MKIQEAFPIKGQMPNSDGCEKKLGWNSHRILMLTQKVLQLSGILPFSVNVVDGKLVFNCPTPLKIFFIGIHLATIFVTTHSMITSNIIYFQQGVDPNSQFEVLSSVFRWTAVANLFNIVWLKPKGFMKICQVSHKLYATNSKLKQTFPSKSLILAWTLCVFPFIRFGYILVQSVYIVSSTDAVTQKYLIRSFSDFPLLHEASLGNKITYIVYIILQCYAVLVFSFAIFTVHLCFWAFYQLCREIEERLGLLQPNAMLVIKIYDGVKDLLDALNAALSTHLAILTMLGIVSFSRYLSSPFDFSLDNESHFEIVLHISFASACLFLGAEGSCKLQGIAGFIFKHRKNVSFQANKEINLILKDLSMNPLGLKAKTILLNYSFLTTVFSTCVTYTIVCVQFSLAQKQENCQTS